MDAAVQACQTANLQAAAGKSGTDQAKLKDVFDMTLEEMQKELDAAEKVLQAASVTPSLQRSAVIGDNAKSSSRSIEPDQKSPGLSSDSPLHQILPKSIEGPKTHHLRNSKQWTASPTGGSLQTQRAATAGKTAESLERKSEILRREIEAMRTVATSSELAQPAHEPLSEAYPKPQGLAASRWAGEPEPSDSPVPQRGAAQGSQRGGRNGSGGNRRKQEESRRGRGKMVFRGNGRGGRGATGPRGCTQGASR